MIHSTAGLIGHDKPIVRGKFLFSGNRKLYIRGVTYGTFRPNGQTDPFPDPAVVEQDFAQMQASGINALRVYTTPPTWILDLAWKHRLYLMIGLAWEQHITFLDQAGLPGSIEKRIRAMVRATRNHPAVLCYVVGNEIPASIVRWHGRRRIEQFINRLYQAVKLEAPDTLVTYVNYPTTEYLHLPFLDFLCFNVYLESPDSLQDYLCQLQHLAGDKPLVMAEIGLDSQRNGLQRQAETLLWQVRTIFAAGCAGVFVFAWMDEWHRGEHDIEDWDFGLTTRSRQAKPALPAVAHAFEAIPFPADLQWPAISVVVCTYNGSRTLRNCLEGLKVLEYPNHEVIVVDDGSTDDSADIARQYPVRLIRQSNKGLSSARNTGMNAASGEIIAYLDDDAWPDPHWLQYLAWTYMNTDYAAVGGPNIPPEDGAIAECVANSPGGPAHVMVSHRDAEHIPGCNCSFRTRELRAIGGFDVQFRTAGDDVDVCWRLLERGGKIGFHAGAMVWHHRRASVRAYLKQQMGYGKAEALLEAKWPEKYSAEGGIKWAGRVYGSELSMRRVRHRIYHGSWGMAPFQRLYTDHAGSMLSAPGWYLANVILAGLLLLSGEWATLRLAALPLLILLLLPFFHALQSVADVRPIHSRVRCRVFTAVLHVLQPMARSWGRFSKWVSMQQRPAKGWLFPRTRTLRVWSEQWQPSEHWLNMLEEQMRSNGAIVRRGGDFDSWDLEVDGSPAARVRIVTAIEEHGGGKQMILFRLRPRVSRTATVLSVTLVLLSALALANGHTPVSVLLVFGALIAAVNAATTCGRIAGLAGASIAFLTSASPIEKLVKEGPVEVMKERAVEVGASLSKRGVDAA